MYSIALEGWRRGLSLKFINNNQGGAQPDFLLSNSQKRFRFSGSRSNLISRQVINLCSDKDMTKKRLRKYNVPVPLGETFDAKASNEEVLAYAKKLGYPLVLKPHNGTSGRGVILNINDESELFKALIYVRQTLNHPKVMIERFISGADYQIYIINNRVIAAFERVRANVVGDGE